MSVKIIAQLHPLRSSRIKVTTASKSIKEILKELNSGFPLSQARVCRNGEIIKDFSVIANDDDVLAVKFVPGSSGSAMKAGGWALMLVGIAISIASWGTLGGVGIALIGSGLGMALGGSVLMNINIPKLKDQEKPENDPSIRGAKNQARPHGRIPVLFGKHRLYPDLAANQHTIIIGNQQYLNLLFCGGYKDCTVDTSSLKLGETLITDLSKTKNIQQILAHQDPIIDIEILQNGEASSLYSSCVHEDMLNAALQNKIEDGNGNKVSGAIERTTPDNTDKINVDIFLQNGIGEYDDEGDLGNASVSVKISYKKDNEAYIQMAQINITGKELKTKRYQATKSGLTPGKYTIKIERVTADSKDSKIIDQVHVGSIRAYKSIRPIRAERQKDLTIIAMRVLATAKLNGIIDSFNYVATAKLPVHTQTGTGPFYWNNAAETQNPAAALMYALQGRAAQQVVDSDDIDYPSIEAFYEWCEDKKYSCNAYLSEAVTIAELMKMIGSTARADILRIDSKITVVQDIERPAPVQLFTPKNTISYGITMMKADVPDMVSMRFIDEEAGFAQQEVKIYNTTDGNQGDYETEPRSNQKVELWGITDSKQARRIGMYNLACLKNRPFVHNIEVDIEYMLCNKGDRIQYAGDIALAGTTQGRIKGLIFIDGVIVGIDTDEPIEMETGKQHAVRIRLKDGAIILKDVRYNPGIPKEKAITYFPGGDEELYEPFVGDMHAVDEENNIYYEPQNIIYFIEPISDINILENIKAGNIFAFGVRGYEAIDLIITDLQPGSNLSASLTCVEHAPEIFGVDDPNFVLPDFENKITPVSGAVDPGTVTPSNWRNFDVFHDSEEEPLRPSGDGQDDGWYKLQTFRSIWQSSKVSESIDSGEWGAPVRIKAHRGTEDITPIFLSLDPQHISLETDVNGNVLIGTEKTSQARLMMWNSLLSGAEFSLVNEPEGIAINEYGLITIGEDAVIINEQQITVRAVYQDGTYSAVLTISKNFNRGSAGYLGTVQTITLLNSSTVYIVTGPVQGQVTAQQTDFVLAVASVDGRYAGSVFQWTGTNWEYRSPDTHSELYMRTLTDGLNALGASTEWFAAVFTRKIMALDAFIQNLQTNILTLVDPGEIKSSVFQEGLLGFFLKHDGSFELNGGKFNGTVTVGDAWDSAGNILNEQARGSFLALAYRLSGDNNYEIRVKNLACFGATSLGIEHGSSTGFVDIYGIVNVKSASIRHRGLTSLSIDNLIQESCTASQLLTKFKNRFGISNRDDHYPDYAINGSIIIRYGSQGGSTTIGITVHRMRRVFTNTSQTSMPLYGLIGISGSSPISIGIYSNRVEIKNTTNNSLIVTISGNSTMDVDIMFL